MGTLECVIQNLQPGLSATEPVGEPGLVTLQPPGHLHYNVCDSLHRVTLRQVEWLVGCNNLDVLLMIRLLQFTQSVDVILLIVKGVESCIYSEVEKELVIYKPSCLCCCELLSLRIN